MEENTEKLGLWIKSQRKAAKVTQETLALTSGTGLRFIIDLEKGKPTCQVGKVLSVLKALGADITVNTKSGTELKL